MDYTTARVSPNVNYGLWVIMRCQGMFIHCNKCTTLVEDVDSVGRELFVLSIQFCCESTTALKSKVY